MANSPNSGWPWLPDQTCAMFEDRGRKHWVHLGKDSHKYCPPQLVPHHPSPSGIPRYYLLGQVL